MSREINGDKILAWPFHVKKDSQKNKLLVFELDCYCDYFNDTLWKKSVEFDSNGILKELAIQKKVYSVINLGSEGTYGSGILNIGLFFCTIICFIKILVWWKNIYAWLIGYEEFTYRGLAVLISLTSVYFSLFSSPRHLLTSNTLLTYHV